MPGTVGCVFTDDCKHPPLPETTARPYPPGVRVKCCQLNSGHHPTNVYFRDAYPHFNIEACNDCNSFQNCGQAVGAFPPGS